MSFFYLCRTCGRGFMIEDCYKHGIANLMFKPSWQGCPKHNGMLHCAEPVLLCPYCLSTDNIVGTEAERSRYWREKRRYPPIDPRWAVMQTVQKLRECDVNVSIADHTINNMSPDAEMRMRTALDKYGWQLSSETVRQLSQEFSRPVLCHIVKTDNLYAYSRGKLLFCCCPDKDGENRTFSTDGHTFVSSTEQGRTLQRMLKLINRILSDFSAMIVL